MILCGNPLPWVDHCKHLGNYVENRIDGMKHDLQIKKAQYINKNNELEQEFHFCHPKTKFTVNKIYNSHFTGSPLWNLFGCEAVKLESTWNRSVKIMYDLPYDTHRWLIEPISESLHIKRILIQRFLNFVKQVRESKKSITKVLLNTIMYSVKSTTGYNLRRIMLETNRVDVNQLDNFKIENIKYHPVKNEDKWKVSVIKGCIDALMQSLESVRLMDSPQRNSMKFVATSAVTEWSLFLFRGFPGDPPVPQKINGAVHI